MRLSNDSQLKLFAGLGAAALAISQSDRDITDPKMWALALAAASAALVTLLRPPGMASPHPPEPPKGLRG
jgi:hypothetical protein